MKTSVLIPTRWRKDGFKRLWDSLHETAEDELEILVGADTDDNTDYGVPCIRYENLGSSQKTYELAKLATGDMIRLFSTDEVVITKGWDVKLYSYFPEDKLAVLYTKDNQKERLGGCVPVVSREWYAVAGYYPKYFWHSCGDTWVTKIAESIGRLIYAEDVVVEHLKKSKGQRDLLHKYAKENDRGAAEIWLKTAQERVEIANRVKELI